MGHLYWHALYMLHTIQLHILFIVVQVHYSRNQIHTYQIQECIRFLTVVYFLFCFPPPISEKEKLRITNIQGGPKKRKPTFGAHFEIFPRGNSFFLCTYLVNIHSFTSMVKKS